ncbi:hypothetical protein PABG_12438 [Paracoccidioides brasiliensis Pb03]|nr:hypothetical protein PABG_12438 [Paracoccidioides brasiliensis Pb03]
MPNAVPDAVLNAVLGAVFDVGVRLDLRSVESFNRPEVVSLNEVGACRQLEPRSHDTESTAFFRNIANQQVRMGWISTVEILLVTQQLWVGGDEVGSSDIYPY